MNEPIKWTRLGSSSEIDEKELVKFDALSSEIFFNHIDKENQNEKK